MSSLLSPEATDRLRACAEARIAALDTPGVAVSVTDREGAQSIVVAGHADLAGTPLRPEHLLEIGSISKSFAAVCLLQLEREGTLSIDDEVGRRLPWFRVGGGHAPITLRHLLTHTAGLPVGSEPGPPSVAHVALLAEAETLWEPGDRFWYSNLGYVILGMVIEAVTGRPAAAEVRRRVLEPLGMTRSAAHIAAEHGDRLATGHERARRDRPPAQGMQLAPVPLLESESADGSIISTPGDMAAYARMLLAAGDGRVLAAADFARMLETVPDDEGGRYGLGLTVETNDGTTIVRHSGGMVGYTAHMLCDLDAGVAAVALANGPAGSTAVAEYAVALARADRAHESLPEPPGDGVETSEHDGRYGPIAVTAGEIEVQGVRARLTRLGDDRFASDHPALAPFLVRFGRTDGRVDHLMHGNDWYPGDGYGGPAAFSHRPEWAGHTGLYRSHNPWAPACRVTLCRGELAVEHEDSRIALTPRPAGGFLQTTPAGPLPELFRFDTPVAGRPQRLDWSGCVYYRAMTA